MSAIGRKPTLIPPDDLDDVILGRMIKEAGVFYKIEKRAQEYFNRY
jgi:hypothetical protein